MCVLLSGLTSGAAPVGLYFAVCDNAPHHLAQRLDDAGVPTASSGLKDNEVFAACVAACEEADHLLVELDYFDSDFRSNAALHTPLRHQAESLRTDRLIFLQKTKKWREPSNYGVRETIECVYSEKAIGYVILNPEPGSQVGRSILPTPPSLKGVKIPISKAVRTTVHETVTIFGSHADVHGIPFMQQDGHLMTCAHASAWMVHYAGVLRGLCARRATVEFHNDQGRMWLIGRQYPSAGLTSWQVATTLEHFGLPTVTMQHLELNSQGHLPVWYDREEIWSLTDELRRVSQSESTDYVDHFHAVENQCTDNNEELLNNLDLFWLRENLTKTICQHLNSGFPCILLNKFHARVITGYLRARDLSPDEENAGSSTAVVAFIVADDQEGPFTVVSVSEIVADLRTKYSDLSLLIPLAPGIWVAGADAELFGAPIFARGIQRGHEAITTKPGECQYHSDPAAAITAIDKYEELIFNPRAPAEGRQGLAIRSYVVPSTDFKRGFAKRCHQDPIAINQVRLAKLPRFVWVVEVLDRGEREGGRSSVVGEVVLDPTDFDLNDTRALILHIPGAIQVRGEQGPEKWHVTSKVELYQSGRYHGSNDWMNDPVATTARWKTAQA